MKTYTILLTLLFASQAYAQMLPVQDPNTKKFAYANEDNNKPYTQYIYDQAGYFLELGPIAPVKQNGKWFLINKKFEAVSPKVDSIDIAFTDYFSQSIPHFLLKDFGMWRFWDYEKRNMSPSFLGLDSTFFDDYWTTNLFFARRPENKIAIIDTKTMSMSPDYDALFIDPYYNYTFEDFWFRKGDKIYHTDKFGKETTIYDYAEETDIYYNMKYFAYKQNGLWNVVDSRNKKLKNGVTDENYFGMPWQEMYFFKVGDQVYLKDGLYGSNFQPISVRKLRDDEETEEAHISHYISYYDNSPILFKREKYGYMDMELNVLIKPEFDSAYPYDLEKHAVVKKNGKWGILDESGNYIVNPTYDKLIPTKDKFIFIAQQNGKYGLLNYNNYASLDFEYDGITETSTGYILTKNYKYGLIDQQLQTVIPIKYEGLKETKRNYFIFKSGEFYGVYDLNSGTELFSILSDNLHPSTHSNFVYYKDKSNTLYLLDLNGKVLLYGPYDRFIEIGGGYISAQKSSNHLFVIFNSNTQTLYNGEYNEVHNFSDGMMGIKIGDKFGFVNENGGLVVPAIYTGIGTFSADKSYVMMGKKYMYINKSGEIIK